MNKVFALAAIMLILATSTSTQAQEGYYVGAQAAVNFLDSHFLSERHCRFENGSSCSIVAGYAWYNAWRFESEIAYRNNRYNLHGTNEDAAATTYHGKIYTWSGMLNGYYDIPLWKHWKIEPYLGAGIGADYVHQSVKILGTKFKGSNTGFAWQLMAGISYFLREDFAVSAEYRFHEAPLRHGHYLQNQSLTLGLRKSFCFSF